MPISTHRKGVRVLPFVARRFCLTACALLWIAPPILQAQSASSTETETPNLPIAIVPVQGAKITGAMDVDKNRAMIAVSGTITAGEHTVPVQLPRRGQLLLCASTMVRLAADASTGESSSAPAGLLMGLDRGALETSFATGKNADVILTPDFRIQIGGPAPATVKVRLGSGGDTCVDNALPTRSKPGSPIAAAPAASGQDADGAYVLVSSVFDGGAYRVKPGQRVLFVHGSLRQVVDHEPEPCGCPPETTEANGFPLAQSEGLAPLSRPANAGPPGEARAQVTVALSSEKAKEAVADPAAAPPHAASPADSAPHPADARKPGFFARVGGFFKRLFGAE